MKRSFSLHPAFLVAAVIAVFAAYRLDIAREQITTTLALGLPLAVGAWALLRANELPDTARRWALVTLLAVAAASEVSTWRAVVPPTPISETALSTKHREAELALPGGTGNFFVELAAPGQASDAEGKVSVVLEREHREQTLEAEFHNHMVKTRRGSGQSVHDSERFHVTLPGTGPVHARLKQGAGSMGQQIQLALFADPIWVRGLLGVMLAGVAVSLWLTGSRLVSFAGFAPVLGMLAVYGWYLPLHLGKNDRTSSLIGIVIVAGALGGFGALAVQTLLQRYWSTARQRPS